MVDKITKLLATLFYLGYSPIIPGSIGALVGLLVYLLVRGCLVLHICITIISIILGFVICERAEVLFGKKDDKRIIFDEFCGMLLVYLLIPYTKMNLGLGFLLYRTFDIIKPFPIKKIEKLHGGAGIILDDICAAAYTCILLFLLHKIIY